MGKELSFVNEVFQKELSDEDLEYNYKKHQPYFKFEVNGKPCCIGLDKILECIVIAEKLGEIPKLSHELWQCALEKFNVNYYEYDIKLP